MKKLFAKKPQPAPTQPADEPDDLILDLEERIKDLDDMLNIATPEDIRVFEENGYPFLENIEKMKEELREIKKLFGDIEEKESQASALINSKKGR
jgi:hypothetical protein